MKTITIDSSTVWTSLPWTQIKEKVFIIQQKLYQYSKECNYQEVTKLQNYILNSSDSKILAIQIIVDCISKYYIQWNQEKYSFSDEDKLSIYESLFESNISCIKIQFIIEQIKQYLVYLCLKPEWEAKLEPAYKLNINNHKQYNLLYRLSKFILKNESSVIYNYDIVCQSINKLLDIEYIIHKIQPPKAIWYYLETWLSNQYITNSLNKNILLEKSINHTISNLYKLLYYIGYNGQQWHNLYMFENKGLYIVTNHNYSCWIWNKNNSRKPIDIYSINLINCLLGIQNRKWKVSKTYYLIDKCLIFNYLIMYSKHKSIFLDYLKSYSIVLIDNNIYRSFIKKIREILYHQNILNKWRSNSNLSLSILLKKIKMELDSFCLYYYPLINSQNSLVLISLIDNLVFRWIKKSKKYLLIDYKNKQHLYFKHKKRI